MAWSAPGPGAVFRWRRPGNFGIPAGVGCHHEPRSASDGESSAFIASSSELSRWGTGTRGTQTGCDPGYNVSHAEHLPRYPGTRIPGYPGTA
eukprot:608254-Rhodomonas_salina.1